MSIDLTKLTPEPWVPDFDDGSIEGVLQMIHHGNVNTVSRTGEQFSHTDLAFIALARSALGVMMRRGWGVVHQPAGRVWIITGCVPQGSSNEAWEHIGKGILDKEWPDPFTALVEADAWYKENVEGVK